MSGTKPEKFIEVYLKEYNIKGYVAIDRLINGRSWGGLRIVPDPTKEEIIASARTMSLKYDFAGLNLGGAKGALELPYELEHKRAEVLYKFGQNISDIIKSKMWMPGNDMGCGLEDIKNLFRGAGVSDDLSKWKDISHIYTAWSVYFSTIAAARYSDSEIRDKTYILQGFGKVGSEYCKLMSAAGARLVGTSTRAGAIYNSEGIDIAEVVKLKNEYGDSFIAKYGKGKIINLDELLELEADIVVPCARCWAINPGNVDNIRAKIVPCAANVAMTIDIESKLARKGIIVIPDFVANVGGVFGSYFEQYLSERSIHNILSSNYAEKVYYLISKSRETDKTVSEIALEEIENRQISKKGDRAKLLKIIFKSIVPGFIKGSLLYLYCSKRYFK